MVRHICHEIVGLGGTALELNVNKKNPAILFYEHLGFYREKEVVIDIGNGFVMDDYIMVLDLTQKPL
jgi:ribosomal protein S18 acetylase RimI-like enzyme